VSGRRARRARASRSWVYAYTRGNDANLSTKNPIYGARVNPNDEQPSAKKHSTGSPLEEAFVLVDLKVQSHQQQPQTQSCSAERREEQAIACNTVWEVLWSHLCHFGFGRIVAIATRTSLVGLS